MQWIFLTLLVGYATAQQGQYDSNQQQQQPQQQSVHRTIEFNQQQSTTWTMLSNNVVRVSSNTYSYKNVPYPPKTPLSISNTGTKSMRPQAQVPYQTSTSWTPLIEPNVVTPTPIGGYYNTPSPTTSGKQGQPLLKAHRPTTRYPQPNTTPAAREVDDRIRFSSPVAAAAVNSNFNADLFNVIASSQPRGNIVYSPISLQLLLAFVSTGAKGRTALQLQQVLSLPKTAQDTAKVFNNLLETNLNSGTAQLVMANKLYHRLGLTVQPDVQLLAPYFASDIEATDFRSPRAAAAAINGWVAQKTQNTIPQLVTAAQLDAQTQAMLVSAIYFKAKWEKEFSTSDTEQQDFYVTPERKVSAHMMFTDDTFRYGAFPELDATGLEMMYENSNISMLILLPNKRDGLAAMEQGLQKVDLKTLAARMRLESVIARIPRFRVDFELDMMSPLRSLGVTDLFTNNAELAGFFRTESVSVSQVQHKAFLDVNEAGSEAAAASFIKLVPLSLPSQIFEFTANHPFMFAIRSPDAVLFIGHVVSIQ